MNFVYVSPHFPANMWLYCQALTRNGVDVLGIGDAALEDLPQELRDNLRDYYRVTSLEDQGEMVRALGYFTWRWGRLDWLESNNEYWLEKDAWLRQQFHITTGPQPEQMPLWKHKSLMKSGYEAAGIKTAPWQLADTFEKASAFAKEAGYPLVVKPDNGVGAAGTYRINDEAHLRHFFDHLPMQPYIIEKCVFGEICSYDALIDSRGEPLYETGNITRGNIMDFVNERQDCVFYIVPEAAEDLKALGRKAVKAFGVKSRFIHFEFFRLSQDQEGLGKRGDLVGLEVNMRPSGGYSSDMMNYAGSVDMYRMWADMILRDRVWLDEDRQTYWCVFLGRRDSKRYRHQHHDLLREWRHRIVLEARLPRALSDTMGDQVYLVRCRNLEEMDAFLSYGTEGA